MNDIETVKIYDDSCDGCLHQDDNSGYCLDCYNGNKKYKELK
jgi:hypothetical protein